MFCSQAETCEWRISDNNYTQSIHDEQKMFPYVFGHKNSIYTLEESYAATLFTYFWLLLNYGLKSEMIVSARRHNHNHFLFTILIIVIVS